MLWNVSLLVSLILLLTTLIMFLIAKRKSFNSILLKPINISIIGVVASSIALLYPVYFSDFIKSGTPNTFIKFLKAMLVSFHHSIRLFMVDGDFDFIIDSIKSQGHIYQDIYEYEAVVLFILAPILTVAFVATLFVDLLPSIRYALTKKKKLYIFSSLNSKTVSLAKSVKATDKKTCIVFANTEGVDKDKCYDYFDEINRLNAIVFKRNLSQTHLKKYNKNINLVFVVLENNEEAAINTSLGIVQKFKTRPNVDLYAFAGSLESELIFNSLDKGNIKLRRINCVHTLILNNLHQNGICLFNDAKQIENQKLISVLIVGLGLYGSEMLRTLVWYCQMSGYRLVINAFDVSQRVIDEFTITCPELLEEAHNNNFEDDGEAQYSINLHMCNSYRSKGFIDSINGIENITYTFIDMSSDDENIELSIFLRTQLEKLGIHSRIQTVVHDSIRAKNIKSAINLKNQSYDLDVIGDDKAFYTKELLDGNALENEALSRHLTGGGDKQSFWNFEYNYKSSLASVLHQKIAEKLGVYSKGSLEHRRWNAYVRSEGYTYGKEKNHLSKTHPDLVTYNLLDEEDKAKDYD